MVKKRLFIKFISLLMLVALSCSSQITESDIWGKYEANHKKGIDILELFADGTYSYYFKSADGKEIVNKNHWSLSVTNGKPELTFDRFIFALPGYSGSGPGFWVVGVEKMGGRIKLCIDPDLNYYYEKK